MNSISLKGYGQVTLKTDLGRGFTILYAFIGIPLLLMLLTDFGKLFTRGIKILLNLMRKIFYAKRLTKIRRVGRTVTTVPTQVSFKSGESLFLFNFGFLFWLFI